MTDERWSVCVRCGCIFKPHVKARPCPACGGSPFGVRPLDQRGESLTNVIANTVTP